MKSSTLYIIPTPIGNLEDVTLRALRILREVDLIVAEDTRHSGILLKKYDIHTTVDSFHSYSDRSKLERIINVLKNGKSVALISDAGTPGISDPGFVLISRAIAEGITVTALPGPTAFVPALVSSGLPTDKFLYLGFLPLKKGRQTLFNDLKQETRTVVFYESPHRIQKTLAELHHALGDRKIAVCRELTKLHEEIIRSTLSEAISIFQQKKPKGEFTLVLAPPDF